MGKRGLDIQYLIWLSTCTTPLIYSHPSGREEGSLFRGWLTPLTLGNEVSDLESNSKTESRTLLANRRRLAGNGRVYRNFNECFNRATRVSSSSFSSNPILPCLRVGSIILSPNSGRGNPRARIRGDIHLFHLAEIEMSRVTSTRFLIAGTPCSRGRFIGSIEYRS